MTSPMQYGGAAERLQALQDDDNIAQEYDMLSSYSDTTDYYSLLALSRDPPPSDAAIRSAYRTLTLSFHPDKQPPHLQESAKVHFEKIQRAYEILIHPQKRVVYDMLGEEGVEREWSYKGLLGKQGEAERMQVGVKAMDKAQFRRWFVRKMKDKEHALLEDLVQSKVHMQIDVDAKNMFTKESKDTITVQLPNVKSSHAVLGFSFKTPIRPIPGLQLSTAEKGDEEDEDEVKNTASEGEEEESLQIELYASVSGKLNHLKRVLTVVDEETQEEKDVEGEMPVSFTSGNFTLGASLEHTVQRDEANAYSINRLLFPFLGDSSLTVGTQLLPTRLLNISWQKMITPLPGTRPFSMALSTAVSHSPLYLPPPLHVSVARQIGKNKVIFCNWSSGIYTWPAPLDGLFMSIAKAFGTDEKILLMPQETSKFEIGFNILPKRVKRQPLSHNAGYTEEDEEATEATRRMQVETKPAPQGNWSFILHTSPANINLTLNYGRYLFTSEPEEPALSHWSYEGYTPQKQTISSPPVRLNIAATVLLDLSTAWEVSATRKFGDFTRMGLGVGVMGQQGLVCSITWSRLGQTLKFPIAVCPLDVVDADIASFAVIVPWLTYSLVEFVYLRPRRRRQQRKEIARQQRRIQKLLAKRKAESLEAIELMKEQVSRRQDTEEQRGGLVILHAEYGHIPPSTSLGLTRDDSRIKDSIVDVTIPVAALVDQGQLNIPSAVIKGTILGFSDPAPFLPKTLRIEYLFGWKKHTVEIPDGEAVTCPMRSHMA